MSMKVARLLVKVHCTAERAEHMLAGVCWIPPICTKHPSAACKAKLCQSIILVKTLSTELMATQSLLGAECMWRLCVKQGLEHVQSRNKLLRTLEVVNRSPSQPGHRQRHTTS